MGAFAMLPRLHLSASAPWGSSACAGRGRPAREMKQREASHKIELQYRQRRMSHLGSAHEMRASSAVALEGEDARRGGRLALQDPGVEAKAVSWLWDVRRRPRRWGSRCRDGRPPFHGVESRQKISKSPPPVQRCAQDMDISVAFERLNNTPALELLSAKRSSFMSRQADIRGVLERLLIGYGYNEPLAPLYKLGVICGVTCRRDNSYTYVSHANFLASSDGGSSWKLFFAEFWNQPGNRIEESKKPFCCPMPDDHKYPGRCAICENGLSVIVHPQSRKYYLGNSVLRFPVPYQLGADTEKLDFDVIYSSEGGGGGATARVVE